MGYHNFNQGSFVCTYCTPTSKWSKWLVVRAVFKGTGIGGGGGGGGGGGALPPLHHFHPPPLTFLRFTCILLSLIPQICPLATTYVTFDLRFCHKSLKSFILGNVLPLKSSSADPGKNIYLA